MRQIGSPSTSTRIIDSFGSSLLEATRCRATLFNPGGQFLLDRFSNLGDREPIEELAKEPLHQHPFGGGVGDAPTLEGGEDVRGNRTHRRTMAAPQNVVVQDLENRLRGCLGLVREQ